MKPRKILSNEEHRSLAEHVSSISNLENAIVYVQKYIDVDHMDRGAAFVFNYFKNYYPNQLTKKWAKLPKSIRKKALFDYISYERKDNEIHA